MQKYYYWIALLFFSMNVQASDVNTETPKSNTQKRVEHILTLLGACGIGCVSGHLCTKLFVPSNSKVLEELPLVNLVVLIIWGLSERVLMDHVTDDLKSLDISHSEGLLRYTVWASSWLSYLYGIGQMEYKVYLSKTR